MKAFLAVAAIAMLAACATAPRPRAPQGACNDEAALRFLGQTATGELGWKMMAATGAKTLRWVPPRTAVTMDFSPDRLTVSYDDDYRILTATCS